MEWISYFAMSLLISILKYEFKTRKTFLTNGVVSPVIKK